MAVTSGDSCSGNQWLLHMVLGTPRSLMVAIVPIKVINGSSDCYNYGSYLLLMVLSCITHYFVACYPCYLVKLPAISYIATKTHHT